MLRSRVRAIAAEVVRPGSSTARVLAEFGSPHYARHNQRRLEHLASLGLPLADRTVLELGAGIGDHTSFFLDRNCAVTSTDGRPENVAVLRARLPGVTVRVLDLDDPDPGFGGTAEVVHCYGTLYHLSQPEAALRYVAARCSDLLLLETCVSPGDEERLNPVAEEAAHPTQAVSSRGCRPTRPWVLARLRECFPYAYHTRTQPWHEEFPLVWTDLPAEPGTLTRAVFVASQRPLVNPTLSEELVDVQTRH
jgi:hypothetical protein